MTHAIYILLLLILFLTLSVRAQQSSPGKEMVWVEGGEFSMGNPLEHYVYRRQQPVHSVKLKNFCIGKYEVTNKEFIEFLHAHAEVLQVDTIDRVFGNTVTCGSGRRTTGMKIMREPLPMAGPGLTKEPKRIIIGC